MEDGGGSSERSQSGRQLSPDQVDEADEPESAAVEGAGAVARIMRQREQEAQRLVVLITLIMAIANLEAGPAGEWAPLRAQDPQRGLQGRQGGCEALLADQR